jgi:hypothetical protein
VVISNYTDHPFDILENKVTIDLYQYKTEQSESSYELRDLKKIFLEEVYFLFEKMHANVPTHFQLHLWGKI